MKISKNKDGSKAVEIGPTDSGDTVLHLQGDASITSDNRVTGYRSNVATIAQTGGVEFFQRPSVGGIDVALTGDMGIDTDTKQITIMDNLTSVIPVTTVQRMVNVLYQIENAGSHESGNITITQNANGFDVSVVQNAESGYFSDIEFTASESNGSLMLNVVGSGAGLITNFYYRVNSINTLYL